MIYDHERCGYALASGRVITLPLNEWPPDGQWWEREGYYLAPEERREIAEEMVMRWAKFGDIRILNAD